VWPGASAWSTSKCRWSWWIEASQRGRAGAVRLRCAPPPLAKLDVRGLDEAETLVFWAQLDNFQGAQSKRAKARLEAAHQAAPGNPEVLLWLGRFIARQGALPAAVRHYRAALRARPKEPRYLLALAAAYFDGDAKVFWSREQRKQKLGEVMEALADRAHTGRQLNAVAIYRLLERDVPAAAQFGRRAREAAPDCWECFHTSAAAAFMAGDVDQAISLELEALTRLPEQASLDVDHTLRKTLARYRSSDADAAQPKTLPPLFTPE
jgi:tetratricopeptide (TPR) repeat protein